MSNPNSQPRSSINDELSAAASEINNASRIIITAHEKPDGDAIGSALGLYHTLKTRNIPSVVAGLYPVPQRYSFLPDADTVTTCAEISPSPGDILAVLDAGELNRTEKGFERWVEAGCTVINIDHHPTNKNFGKYNCVDPDAASTGDIIYHLCKAADWGLSPETALCLWVAIISDTGRFAFDNTSPELLRIAADIREAGNFSTSTVNDMIFENHPLKRFKLHERAARSLEMKADNRLAVVSLRLSDFAELGCSPEDADEVVTIPRSIAGVDVAAFIYELKSPKGVKLSIRTKEPFDAALLCKTLGGGGHARAAGCSLNMPFEEAKKTFTQTILNEWF